MTREEITQMVSRIVRTNEGIIHISDMLESIQEYLITGNPTSKFISLCANENWEYAKCVADSMNNEVLLKTMLFQDFVKKIKTSGEYISKIRNEKLNDLGI